MRIRAKLRAMAASEIMNMIPDETMKQIKKKDKNPLFKAFIIGQEGEAKGNLVGIGNIIKRWFKDVIKKLYDKIKIGLELFHGHAATNDIEGRVPVGKVVAKKLTDIWDKSSVIAICYIYPDFRNLPFDVASIEADLNLEYEKGANLLVADVNDVTAIALGNSAIETPGFPGATLLGQLQAFIKENNIDFAYKMPNRLRLGYSLNHTDQQEKLKLVEET